MNLDFDRTSPIPEVNQALLERIYRSEVILPPRARFAPGNQSVEGLLLLTSLGCALQAGSLFEIGTYNGLTAWTLARNLPDATVHTLDLPPDEEPSLPLGPYDAANRVGSLHTVLNDLEPLGNIVQHWGDSAAFDFSPWESTCDLVYVDGAHSVEFVMSDTRNALRMVSECGSIVWDDYWRGVPEVARVLDSRSDLGLMRVPGTRLVMMLTPGAAEKLAAG